MHPNPAFRETPKKNNIAFARERSFGSLAVNGDDGPLVSHIPFQLSPDGKYLEAHLVRSNPIVRVLGEPIDAVISVLGPDGYISPDWYGVDNQVPTWNYVAVHLRGLIQLLEHDELHGVLERLSTNMEERLISKAPWKIDKMTPEIYARMQRQIVPVAMQVSDIQGTWKLAQNKEDAVRVAAVASLRGGSIGSEIDHLAGLMSCVDGE